VRAKLRGKIDPNQLRLIPCNPLFFSLARSLRYSFSDVWHKEDHTAANKGNTPHTEREQEWSYPLAPQITYNFAPLSLPHYTPITRTKEQNPIPAADCFLPLQTAEKICRQIRGRLLLVF